VPPALHEARDDLHKGGDTDGIGHFILD